MRHFSLLLVIFLGEFASILLSLDHQNLDHVHIDDSTSVSMMESWEINNNIHPRNRFLSDNINAAMTSTIKQDVMAPPPPPPGGGGGPGPPPGPPGGPPPGPPPSSGNTLPTTSYSVQVGNLMDSDVNTNGCSQSSKLSTCNVRSAWALCLSLIKQQSCGSLAIVKCAVMLPSNTTSMVMSGTYGAMKLTALTSWATTCTLLQVSLSVVSSVTGGLMALVQGDVSSSAFVDAENVRILTLIMSDIKMVGFGDGTVTFLSAVVVNALQSAVFQRMSFYGNVGYSTGSGQRSMP